MNKLIKKYLNSFFLVENQSRLLIKKGRGVISCDELINELKLIFNLSRKQLKYFIKSWCLKNNKSFNFKAWWQSIDIHETLINFLSFEICKTIDSLILNSLLTNNNELDVYNSTVNCEKI